MSSSPYDSSRSLLKELLSHERFGVYRRNTFSDDDAVELHQQTLMLGSRLMSCVAIVEIALRNSVRGRLLGDNGVWDWTSAPFPDIVWHEKERRNINKAAFEARRNIYYDMNPAAQSRLRCLAFPAGVPRSLARDDILDISLRQIEVTDHQILTHLTFYFWKRLFSKHYEETLWKRSLMRIFPNKTIRRADVSHNLEIIYQTRNRLAHHEPVIGDRLADTVAAMVFVGHNLLTRSPDPESPAARLLHPHLQRLELQRLEFEATRRRLCRNEDGLVPQVTR